MNEPAPRPKKRKFWKYLLLTVLSGLLLFAGLGWYATTASFRNQLRERLISELQRITGGRVEIGSLHIVPFRLRVIVRGLTIHGLESPTDIPLFHAEEVTATARIISLTSGEFALERLHAASPVIHIIVNPDGTSNIPGPQINEPKDKSPIEQLFALAIGKLQIEKGELIYGDQRVPLDFTAHDVNAEMNYGIFRRRFYGFIRIGKGDTTLAGYRPFSWSGETRFTLSREGATLHELRLTSAGSSIDAKGTLQDFNRPQVGLEYNLKLDLAEVAAILREPSLRRGLLQADGKGSWAGAEFSTLGKLILRDLEWRETPVGLHNANLDTDFSLTSKKLTLSRLRAQLMRGSTSGEATVNNWQDLAYARPENKRDAGRQPLRKQDRSSGSLNLKFKDVSVEDVAAALSTSVRPFHRLHLAGMSNGNLDVTWREGIRSSEVRFLADVQPPAGVTSAQMPLSMHATGVYRLPRSELELADLHAATRATRVQASGTLSRSARMKFSVTTSNLAEWQPVLDAVGYTRIPVTLRGPATFTGTAVGKLSDIDFSGSLESQNFSVLVPAQNHQSREIDWDSFSAQVEISPRQLGFRHATLHHGTTVIAFDLSAALQNRQFTDLTPLVGDLSMANADVADTLALAGLSYPATGTFDLTFRLSGTRAQPQGAGHVQLHHGTLYGRNIDSLSSDLTLQGSQIQLNNLALALSGGKIDGAGTYDLASQAIQLNLQGKGFDLAHLPDLQRGRVHIDGKLDFQANASGTLSEPVVNAALHVNGLSFDHELAGDFDLKAITHGSEMQLSGKSQFAQAELELGGTVSLRADWPTNLSVHFNHLDVDSLLRDYLKGRVTGHSALAGDITLTGPLRQPQEIRVAGTISDLMVDVENVKLRNNGPARFSASRESVNIETLRLIGEGTDLSVGGTASLMGDRRLDLKAKGSVNLKLVETFDPDFTSSGLVTVDMGVYGTLSKPITQGRVKVENGSVAYVGLPSALSDINGSLFFNQDRLQIETLNAHTGGGAVSFSGFATYYRSQLNFDLSLHGQSVRLRYPPGISSTADADLRFAGTPAESALSGDITVNKLAMTPGFDFGGYLERSAQTSALPPTNPLLNRIRMDVHIVTAPELQMQTASIRLSGDADLRLRGTAAKPVIVGRADVIEGEVFFNGTRYRLERGDVTFINPVTTTPVLDLQATTRVRDYDISLNLNGPVDRPSVTYRSEPPLPTSDIIALLAFGQTSEQSAQLQSSGNELSFDAGASSAILNAALNATVSSRVQRLFGVSRIKIDPQGLVTETSPTQTGPAVTVEQQVKNDLTITYTTNVAQASQQIIQVEYNVSRNVSIVGLRDQNGVVSFDVRIRQRKK